MRTIFGICLLTSMITTAAYAARAGSKRVNEDCKSEIQFGMNSTAGNRSTLDLAAGLKACTDNEKRRWAFEGDTLIVKTDNSERSHDVEGSYDHRFGDGWFATVSATHEANSANGLQSRFILAPGVGLERLPEWGTVRFRIGLGRTWEDTRNAGPTSFPEAWSRLQIRWKVRPNIVFREKVDVIAETRDQSNYWVDADTNLDFKFAERFSLETGVGFRWDHKPAPGYGTTDWRTRTLFVFSWGK